MKVLVIHFFIEFVEATELNCNCRTAGKVFISSLDSAAEQVRFSIALDSSSPSSAITIAIESNAMNKGSDRRKTRIGQPLVAGSVDGQQHEISSYQFQNVDAS